MSGKTRRGFDQVRTAVVALARAQPPSVTRFPRSYLTLEGLILSERRLRTPPVISFDMFSEMAVQVCDFSVSLVLNVTYCCEVRRTSGYY